MPLAISRCLIDIMKEIADDEITDNDLGRECVKTFTLQVQCLGKFSRIVKKHSEKIKS